MRDTSAWTGSIFTGKFNSAVTLRQRAPHFHWYSGGDYYTIAALGETWGDSPNVRRLRRAGELPDVLTHGGFAVMGDSTTLSNGHVLRVTSERAGNQGNDFLWKDVVDSSDLIDDYAVITPANPARAWTGIAVEAHSTPLLGIAYWIRATDNKMVYAGYLSGTGWGSTFLYSNSPAFDLDGTAIAAVGDSFGFVYTYDPDTYLITLYNFNVGTWISQAMPDRFDQHPLNGHWFDAEPLGNDWLVTYCVNGTQMATIFDGASFADPWPIFGLDPEFGAAQTRICKLTTIGSKIVGTAWSRFANGNDEYDVSYYHLVWTEDGYNWAIPQYGFIGQTASRGKLHVIDDEALIIGSSVCYVGDAVTWLGGTVGTSTLSSRTFENQVVQDLDAATEYNINALMQSGDSKALLTYGTEGTYSVGIYGESNVNVGTFVIDTPGNQLTSDSDEMRVVGRGPLKEMIAFSAPMDRTFEGPKADHQNFDEGGVYARWGDWSTENGVAYCETHNGESSAVATVGTQYRGQFQITTRLRASTYVDKVSMGAVFWYESPEDFYYFFLTGNTDRAILRQVAGGQSTSLVNEAVTGGVTAGSWYNVCIRYVAGTLYVWIKPDGGSWQSVVSFSSWDTPEPQRWYTGLYAELPRTTTTATLDATATHKVQVVDTSLFPSSGTIKINEEAITYGSKTLTQFGSGAAGSLIRGVHSTAISHPEGSNVNVDRCRVEFSDFSIYQFDRAMSIAEACKYLVTNSGVSCDTVQAVVATGGAAGVYTSVQGHGWIIEGTYSANFKVFFWTNSTATPTSGIELRVTTTLVSVYDVVGGLIATYPVDVLSSGTFRCYAKYNTIILWCNGKVVCGVNVPGDTPRIGSVAVDANVETLTIDELCEPVDAFAWVMQETARDVLSRLIEGRDARLHETYDNKVKVTLLRTRPDLGTLDGTYTLVYTSGGADQEWASAIVAWGAEDWTMAVDPDADELRWTQWQAPYIYDRATLKDKAMERVRKLYALRNVRSISGPYDPRFEVGDEIYIDSIRGLSAGKYIIQAVSVMGTDRTLDMEVALYKAPDDITQATWGIVPGIDRPTRS